MLAFYAGRLPAALRRQVWTISLRYPPPIGAVRLMLRDNRGADLYIWSEVFQQQVYALPFAAPPATILDLGANIGLAAVYFARSFPAAAIACVEPAPDNLELLRCNLAMNCVDVRVFAAAVHSENGVVEMRRGDKDYGHAITRPGSDGERFEVAAVTVPAIMECMGWERIALAKIDIEGHETVLLSERCDWLRRVDAICLEYHVEGAREHLGALAERYGFRPPRVLPRGLWFLSRE